MLLQETENSSKLLLRTELLTTMACPNKFGILVRHIQGLELLHQRSALTNWNKGIAISMCNIERRCNPWLKVSKGAGLCIEFEIILKVLHTQVLCFRRVLVMPPRFLATDWT